MPAATLESILTTSTTQQPPPQLLRLRLTDTFTFHAGQYLEVLHPSGAHIPLSIASAPGDLPTLDLIYRSTPGDPLAASMDELLQTGAELQLSAATGDVCVASDPGAVLLIASGTGIAQARSIVRMLVSSGADHKGRITLLWCLEQADTGLPLEDLAELMNNQGALLHTVVDPQHGADNRGLVWLAEHVTTHRYDRVIVSGAPPFVYAVADKLDSQQIGDQLESDVFSYAPRPTRPK